MPFNTLILACLLPGTSLSDSGTGGRVSLQPQSGELALFFDIDNSIARSDLGVTGALCDGLVLYQNNGENTLCLIELKGGSDIKRAVEQVINTQAHLKQALSKALKGKTGYRAAENIQWKAYICQHGSSPKDFKRFANELEKAFGRNNYRVQHDKDLSGFLRR